MSSKGMTLATEQHEDPDEATSNLPIRKREEQINGVTRNSEKDIERSADQLGGNHDLVIDSSLYLS